MNDFIDLLIGTYTRNGKSEGIHVFRFNKNEGTAVLRSTFHTSNPSYVTTGNNRRNVYVVNENADGKGRVSALSYEVRSGKLKFINQRFTLGDNPCHIIINNDENQIIVSNYGGGSFSVFPIEKDGSVGEIMQLIEHKGYSVDPERQKQAHVHSAFFNYENDRLFVQDLGLDKIRVYHYLPHSSAEPLDTKNTIDIKATPGGGPRHIAWSINGKFLYLLQEMSATILTFEQKGMIWSRIQEIDINKQGFKGKNGAADIKISPDGQYLYATNRGEANVITTFAIDNSSGVLTQLVVQSVLGLMPRNFNITPDGNFLLVANQGSDEVVVFSRDKNTGYLRDTTNRIIVGEPVCLVFLE